MKKKRCRESTDFPENLLAHVVSVGVFALACLVHLQTRDFLQQRFHALSS